MVLFVLVVIGFGGFGFCVLLGFGGRSGHGLGAFVRSRWYLCRGLARGWRLLRGGHLCHTEAKGGSETRPQESTDPESFWHVLTRQKTHAKTLHYEAL